VLLSLVLRDLKDSGLSDSGTVNVSFRLDSSLRDRLADEARKRHLSLNAYVGEALQRSIEWGILQAQFEYVSVSREMLEIFLHQVGDADIAATARSVLAPRFKDLATLIHGKTDLDGLLLVLQLTAKYQYPIPVTYSVREDDEGFHIFLRHGISQKWSVYLGEGCLAYLEGIQLRGSYEATDKSLTLTISAKRPQRK